MLGKSPGLSIWVGTAFRLAETSGSARRGYFRSWSYSLLHPDRTRRPARTGAADHPVRPCLLTAEHDITGKLPEMVTPGSFPWGSAGGGKTLGRPGPPRPGRSLH